MGETKSILFDATVLLLGYKVSMSYYYRHILFYLPQVRYQEC